VNLAPAPVALCLHYAIAIWHFALRFVATLCDGTTITAITATASFGAGAAVGVKFVRRLVSEREERGDREQELGRGEQGGPDTPLEGVSVALL
jgi:hypothetical protein